MPEKDLSWRFHYLNICLSYILAPDLCFCSWSSDDIGRDYLSVSLHWVKLNDEQPASATFPCLDNNLNNGYCCCIWNSGERRDKSWMFCFSDLSFSLIRFGFREKVKELTNLDYSGIQMSWINGFDDISMKQASNSSLIADSAWNLSRKKPK